MLQRLLLLPIFAALILLVPHMAIANAPVRDGFAGAGRSGIPREALFTNPAAVSALQHSWVFSYFTKSRMRDQESGGRNLTVGVYDGQNENFKAGFAYNRESRARVTADGITYLDRTELRASAGRMLTPSISGGITGRYLTRRRGTEETKKFDGDVGILFPIFSDLFAGLTYENVANTESENPPTVGAGLKYGLMNAIGILGDASRPLKGDSKGEYSWAVGAELSILSDFYLRGGFYRDRVNNSRGKSVGISWAGPRASFDYSLRMAAASPREFDHSFGLSVQL